MTFGSDEFKEFTNSLAKRLVINSPLTLFCALQPGKRPEMWVGTNAYWDHEVCVLQVHDDIMNDIVLMIRYKGLTKIFRQSEAKKFENKDVYLKAYEDLQML